MPFANVSLTSRYCYRKLIDLFKRILSVEPLKDSKPYSPLVMLFKFSALPVDLKPNQDPRVEIQNVALIRLSCDSLVHQQTVRVVSRLTTSPFATSVTLLLLTQIFLKQKIPGVQEVRRLRLKLACRLNFLLTMLS